MKSLRYPSSLRLRFSLSLVFTFGLLVAEGRAQSAAPVTFTIEADKPVAKVSPLHYGLMTEEINHCYDGGLYAELVQNRVFKDSAQTPVHWSAVKSGDATAAIALDESKPLNDVLTTSLRLDATAVSDSGRAGVANDGYWGIPVKSDTRYRASFYAKAAAGFTGPVTIAIESDDGATVYARAEVPRLTADWQSYSVTLTTGMATPTDKARLVLTVNHPGTVWFNLVSLFPPTWNNRANGNRIDLMQLLADLHPRFLRFPGGNYLEGDTIATRFQWKKSIGPLTQRAGHPGCWEYRSSDGMGLLEFLEWCEDLKMEPLLAVFAGYSLKGEHVAGPGLEPFTQEALEEIEYVTGDVSTKWGARRAQDGHPAPFKLTYVEIGNEDWFDKSISYDSRFTQVHDAIIAKYPHLKCIASIGNEQPAKKRAHSRKPDAVDEHYYASADEFFTKSVDYYGKYDRKGPEIFVGEWAAHEDAKIRPWTKNARQQPPTPNLKVALGDAAFMTDMERNSDLVVMQCYAPLLVNVNPGAWQWRPDLIGYNALKSYGSPSYYAIQMFSRNVGDVILKGTFGGLPAGATAPLFYTVTKDTKTGVIYLKIVNPKGAPQPTVINVKDAGALAPTATALTLAGQPEDTNSLDEPTKVVPVASNVSGIAPAFTYTFPPYSITVLQLNAR
ncbi:MAG: carbohydrate binding domain-containing protein [Verrucomicrobia bacterium]|nr:carbohydrate binding domain-containing protein [Verrucomicrobiota bacterium]